MRMLVLPYPVSANRYWRPVRIGQHITIVPTKDAKQFKAEVGWIAKQSGIAQPITGRVSVRIALYPQRPLDWEKRAAKEPMTWDDGVRCIDLDNATKVLLDALRGITYQDDAQVFHLESERMEPDARGARVVITITQIVRKSPQAQIAEEALP